MTGLRHTLVTGASRGIGAAIAVGLARRGHDVALNGLPDQEENPEAVAGKIRVLAQEVGPRGITVNCVCPGIILTDLGRVNLEDRAIREAWIAKTAMARIGTPEDVVGPVAFFASEDAAFVTGQTLNVDGGIVFS